MTDYSPWTISYERPRIRRELKLALAGTAFLLSSLGLSGCVVGAVALVGAGATGASMVAQDRTVGEGVDDISIDSQVQTKLARAGGEDLNKIDVKVTEGEVLLTGFVKSDELRMQASQLAWSVDHVKQVYNEVKVGKRGALAHAPEDVLISSRIRMALMADRGVKQVNYGIETVNGTVYLFGKTRSRDELHRATERARAIPGVKEVISYVQLGDDTNRQAMADPVATHQLN